MKNIKSFSVFEQEQEPLAYAVFETFPGEKLLGIFVTYDEAFEFARTKVPSAMLRSLTSEGWDREDARDYIVETNDMIMEIENIQDLLRATDAKSVQRVLSKQGNEAEIMKKIGSMARGAGMFGL